MGKHLLRPGAEKVHTKTGRCREQTIFRALHLGASVQALHTGEDGRRKWALLTAKVLSEDSETLKETLAELQITLKPSVYKMDVRPLLKVVLEAFFGPSLGLVDMLTRHIPSPVEAAEDKVRHTYTGPMGTDIADSMIKCDPKGPTVVQVTKLYHTSDAQEFRAFGRVMSGTIKRGDAVKVLGEGYSLEDEEDMVSAIVEGIMLDESRSVMPYCTGPAADGAQIYSRYRFGSCRLTCPPFRSGRFDFQNSYYRLKIHRRGPIYLPANQAHDSVRAQSGSRAYRPLGAAENARRPEKDQ